MSSAPHVSLWLIPAEPERTALQLLIDGLAARFGGAPFPAHVTLCSDPEPDATIDRAALARELAPALPELLRVDALASAHAESGDRKDVASWRHRVLARVHAAGGDR